VPTGNLGPCTLEGRFVRLEPLRESHTDELARIATKLDWSLFLYPLLSRDDVVKRIMDGIEREKRNEEYAFAVVLKKENRVVGSTSYLTIVSRHKRAEIGSTWYEPEFQGTYVNPESKFLLLRHAFEDWGAVRMQLGTHMKNLHSQRAILKIGAKFEGRLRNYGIMPDGTPRDSMLYSITSSEWPGVKSRLVKRIKNY
jgi:RimJ/RimL family protein N-acetyltransferase